MSRIVDDAEVDEHLRTDAVLARVGREAELLVRLDGVAALVLERVRPQLVAEADAAPFVTAQVDDDARCLRRRSARSAASSCRPQSQRSEPNTSPVRHSECTRTSTFVLARHLAAHERHVLHAVEQALEHVAR